MRRTDFCHPYELRAPAPRTFPTRSAGCPAWTSPRFLGSGRHYRRTECFTTLENASADRHCVLTSSSIPSRAGDTSVGVFFPRHSGDRASDTPVAISRLHPQRFIELPRCCLFLCLRPSLAFLRVGRDRRMRRSPSPSSAPSRESRRLVLDWDAFYR